MDLSIALENIVRLLNDVTFIPVAAGVVLVLTQLVKSVTKWEGNRASLVALAIQAAFWVVYSVLKARGMGDQFEQWTKAAETILTTLVTILFPAVLSGLGTQAVYNRLAAKQAPGFRKVKPLGYIGTPPAAA